MREIRKFVKAIPSTRGHLTIVIVDDGGGYETILHELRDRMMTGAHVFEYSSTEAGTGKAVRGPRP
ncbi:MAG: hypothetical protein ACP5UZ_09180, partial [Thermoplasmata archaeon]